MLTRPENRLAESSLAGPSRAQHKAQRPELTELPQTISSAESPSESICWSMGIANLRSSGGLGARADGF